MRSSEKTLFNLRIEFCADCECQTAFGNGLLKFIFLAKTAYLSSNFRILTRNIVHTVNESSAVFILNEKIMQNIPCQ